jgi:hypothetical protein
LAQAAPTVKCERRYGDRNLCIATAKLAIDLLDAYRHRFTIVRTDNTKYGLPFCPDDSKTGVVFKSHSDFFENDEVEITLSRAQQSPFVTVFFRDSYKSYAFNSNECESVYKD